MTDHETDCLFAAATADGTVSVVGGVTTRLVRETARRHAMSPTAAVAVGRLATGTTLIGAALKGRERVSLQIVGDGPLGSIVAEVGLLADGAVGTRAYAKHPTIDLPRNAVGAVDVRHAIGAGRLQVTKTFEIGQPFVGITALRTSEIDDDIAAYFTQSQQIPGIVALGVVEENGDVAAAGGVIAQVMPSADESVFAELERRSKALLDIHRLVREGAGPRDLVRALLPDAPLRSEQTLEVRFFCRCTRERVETALLGLGRDDLAALAEEQPTTEAVCEYCRRVYEISADEVRGLAARFDEPPRGIE